MINTSISSVFEDMGNISFISTVGEDGLPHISVYNSLLKKDNNTLMWGEYCRGLSKKNAEIRKKIGFITISSEMKRIKGVGEWTHKKDAGEEHDMLNNISRLRYNATYGYSFVHFINVIEILDRTELSHETLTIAKERTENMVEAQGGLTEGSIFHLVAIELFEDSSAIRMLSYIDEKGYPRLLYIPQAMLVGKDEIIFDLAYNREELSSIRAGSDVAILSFVPGRGSSIMPKGKLKFEEKEGEKFGRVIVEKIYNPNTPKAGIIYPPQKTETVRRFAGRDCV